MSFREVEKWASNILEKMLHVTFLTKEQSSFHLTVEEVILFANLIMEKRSLSVQDHPASINRNREDYVRKDHCPGGGHGVLKLYIVLENLNNR